MAGKAPLTVKAFLGLNTLHTRQLGQLSAGQNCLTQNGSLKTRDGGSIVAGAFTNPIKSIHGAVQSGAERLLVEEGTNLWHRQTVTGDWISLKTGLTGDRLSSCRWEDYLILVNNNEMMAYDIAAGTIADLGGSPPDMEYVLEHNHIIFGWSPTGDNPNKVYFCGYTDGTVRRDKDVWDVDEYNLDIGGNSGNPVMGFLYYNSHFLAITKTDFYRIYGSTESDFSIYYGGPTSLVNPRCVAKVKDYIMWLGQEGRYYHIYAYSGTTPVPVSIPVEELFDNCNFDDPWAYGDSNEFMLFLPDADNNQTVVFVFDVLQKLWQAPLIYPAVFNCITEFGQYMQRQYYTIGLNDGTLVQLDDSENDWGNPITSEFKVGSFEIDARKQSIKNIWFNADPKNDFSFDVYAIADDKDEKGPKTISFSKGAEVDKKVKFGTFRGQNLSLRCITTDKINELQKITIVTVPKDVK